MALRTCLDFTNCPVKGKIFIKFNIAFSLVPLGTILSLTVLSHTGQAFLQGLINYKYLIPSLPCEAGGSFISTFKKIKTVSKKLGLVTSSVILRLILSLLQFLR